MTISANWNAAACAARTFSDAWTCDEPGGAIVGFGPGGVEFTCSGGLANLATGAPFTAETVVRYASITKHAFCAMVLRHGDVIGLDDRLGDHLPELQPPLADVTVGRALDMTGGLPDARECLTLLGLSVYTETEADSLLDFLASLTRLNFDAGSEISYSNTGYRLVETALARKGLSFNDFVTSEIAAPLGIFMRTSDVWYDPIAGLAPGYWKSAQGWRQGAAGMHVSASGSLVGSGLALSRWAQALVSGEGPFKGLLGRLSADRCLSDGRATGYGLGLRWNEIAGRHFVGHGGSHPGYRSYFLLDPVEMTGIVVVSNTDDANAYKMARDCMAALCGLPLPQSNCTIPDGVYVADAGPFWLAISNGVANWLDGEDVLYDIGDGWFSSMSPSSPVTLRWTGEALEGEIGYVARQLRPVAPMPAGNELNGHWQAPLYGAGFDIGDGQLTMGIGPTRRTVPLEALGGGRALFTLRDGLWSKRVCLCQIDENRIELVLNRSRVLQYVRSS